MKNTIKKHYKGLIVSLCFLLLFIYTLIMILNHNVELAKKDMEIKDIKEIHKIRLELARKPSQIEKLSGNAEGYRRMAVEEFEFAQAGIAKGEEMLLKAKCYKEQVNRLMNNKDYSNEYCEVLENLEQFKVKK